MASLNVLFHFSAPVLQASKSSKLSIFSGYNATPGVPNVNPAGPNVFNLRLRGEKQTQTNTKNKNKALKCSLMFIRVFEQYLLSLIRKKKKIT